MASTPKITGMSRVQAAFEESDQRRYWVPCPRCHECQTLKFAQLRWPKGEPEKAVYGESPARRLSGERGALETAE